MCNLTLGVHTYATYPHPAHKRLRHNPTPSYRVAIGQNYPLETKKKNRPFPQNAPSAIMSQKSISSRGLEHESKRRSFINKILSRKLLAPSPSSSKEHSTILDLPSVTSVSQRRKPKLQVNGGLISDADSFLDDESSYDSGDESEPQDVMLNAGDVSSVTDDSELYAKRNEKVEFPMYGNSVATDEDLPWSGLTYEALVAPKYVRTARRSQKSPRVLENVFLAQELRCTPKEGEASDLESDDDPDVSVDTGSINEEKMQAMNPNEVLVMEFSRDGKYLAVAGRDCRITVWKVISSPLSKLQFKNYEANRSDASREKKMKVYNSAPVFHQEPVRVFEGHTSTILSLDWSKNNFLISGSMDRTVRLWNVERPGCLETFKHLDFVTAVQFHPNDDRFFLSGSLDNYVRLWSILESSVTYTKDLGDDVLVTTLTFTPYGNYCLVGGFNGSVFFLETKGLHVVERHELSQGSSTTPFRHKNNKKITGIKVFENESASDVSYDKLSKYNILVTTNDSKIRLVDLRLKKVVTKFKGNSNSSSSIVASLSEDCRFIISASEDHWCYLWENDNSIINNKLHMAMKDIYLEGKNHINEKHKKISKFLHENKIWRRLNFFEDSKGHVYAANENNSYTSFHPHHTKVNVAMFAPESTKKLLEFSDDIIYDLVKRGPKLAKSGIYPPRRKKYTFSPSTGLDQGYIIITSDTTGLIRVFRQDSAYYVRKSLVEIRKNCTKGAYSARDCHLAVLHGNRMDTSTISQKLMRTRSFSPPNDGNPFDPYLVKSKILKQLKSQPQLQPPPLFSSASVPDSVPRLQASKSLRIPTADDTAKLVSLASHVNLRNLNQPITKDKPYSFNFVGAPLRSEVSRSDSSSSNEYILDSVKSRSSKGKGMPPIVNVSSPTDSNTFNDVTQTKLTPSYNQPAGMKKSPQAVVQSGH